MIKQLNYMTPIMTISEDVTLNVGSTATFTTVTAALNYLCRYTIAKTATVTIAVAAETITEPGVLDLQHPDSLQISIDGASPVSISLTSVTSNTAWANNLVSYTLAVSSVDGLVVGDVIGFQKCSGGSNPYLLNGLHKITAVGTSTITVATPTFYSSAVYASGAVTATGLVYKSTITTASGNVVLLGGQFKALKNLTIMTDPTSGSTALQVRTGVNVAVTERIHIYARGSGIITHSSNIYLSKIIISGAIYTGLSVSGGTAFLNDVQFSGTNQGASLNSCNCKVTGSNTSCVGTTNGICNYGGTMVLELSSKTYPTGGIIAATVINATMTASSGSAHILNLTIDNAAYGIFAAHAARVAAPSSSITFSSVSNSVLQNGLGAVVVTA